MIKTEEMEKLPEGWRISSVKDLFIDGRGRVISEEEIKNKEGIYPVFSSQTRGKGELGKINTYDFEGEYITWTTDGANAGTVFYRSGRFNCTNVCGTLRARNKDVCLKYFAYMLSTVAKRYVSYVGNPKLMNNVFREIELTHPANYCEQQKIAEILETVDNAIENTDAIIEKYKRIKQGLMQDLLTRGIIENYESGIMNDELGVGSHESEIGNWELRDERKHKFKDSLLGKIPEEWEVVSLGDIGKIITGSTPPTLNSEYYGDHYLFISPEDITDSRFIGDSQKKLSESGFKISRPIPPNSICTVCIGSTIGKVGMTTSICTTNQQINSIVPDTDICNPDALFYLVLFYSQTPLKQEAGLQAVPIVNKSRFSRIQIPLPPLPEQQRIASILSQVDEVIEKEQKYKEKLERIKRGLMEDLLTGRIRVNSLIEHGYIENGK